MTTVPAPDDSRAARPERHLSLRARLTALVVAVAAVALIAVDVVIPFNVHAAILGGKRQTLTSVVENLQAMGSGSLNQQLGAISSRHSALGGEVGWTIGHPNGKSQVVRRIPAIPNANPSVGWDTSEGHVTTVADLERPDEHYLALGYRAYLVDPASGEAGPVAIVAWIPLADVHDTLRRLVVLEIVISLALLVLLGLAAGFIIRREMRPLETMARAADDIAGGDLSRRVTPGAPATEVGRLGTAFNGMVDGVSQLLAERDESEHTMRQFVADASHELRTPVAAIRGYTDLYRAGALADADAIDRAMERMGFESRRMGALAGDLLTLLQADQSPPPMADEVDIVPLCEGVIDDAAVIDTKRTWRLAGTNTHAVVVGDAMRLHQLFANLLANVRTHTPPGTIATVSVAAAADVVAVTVSDDGPGVPEEALPHLTDRFFRIDKARSRASGGSGLGLSIAAAIVRMHRGRMTASATAGGGLTMTVILPAPASRPGPHPAAGPAGGPAAGPNPGPESAGAPADGAHRR